MVKVSLQIIYVCVLSVHVCLLAHYRTTSWPILRQISLDNVWGKLSDQVCRWWSLVIDKFMLQWPRMSTYIRKKKIAKNLSTILKRNSIPRQKRLQLFPPLWDKEVLSWYIIPFYIYTLEVLPIFFGQIFRSPWPWPLIQGHQFQ